MVFKDLYVLVLWTKVASALEGFNITLLGSSLKDFAHITRLLITFTLGGTLESFVCYSHTFENNLGIKRKFTKYLKKSSFFASDQQFSFRCFPENASVGKIFTKSSGLFWPV